MEVWALILLSLSFCTALLVFGSNFFNNRRRLPPGPLTVPLLGNLLWLRHSFQNIEPLLRELHLKYGPILTVRFGSRPAIFISDRRLAHIALVEHGAAFADRPPAPPATRFLSSDQHIVSSAHYGPLWRLLRRNLTSEILHPSRVKIYADGRNWVLGLLLNDLQSKKDKAVVAMESFQFAMFSLLVLMCFGEKLGKEAIKDIESVQRSALLFTQKLNVFRFLPRISKFIFHKQWRAVMERRRRQTELYVPLIRSRQDHKLSQQQQQQRSEERYVYSYVDSLLDIRLPEEGGRRLTEDEIISLCSEFLVGGTDTTATALQWIMANLVKHQEIQRKLAEEIEGVVGSDAEEVKEEELQQMPYLKAVVLEGLRRHSPTHLLLPHAVTEEVSIGGYVIPKEASVNFMVADMNCDTEIWAEPMEFRPERFMAGGEGEGVDITGSREIKMMPFGVGRRICPGLGLALLHLEYFVANLARVFEWKKVEGEEVDMAEKRDFATVMKYPLRARIVPRRENC